MAGARGSAPAALLPLVRRSRDLLAALADDADACTLPRAVRLRPLRVVIPRVIGFTQQAVTLLAALADDADACTLPAQCAPPTLEG